MKNLLTAMLVILGISMIANAGWLVEPEAGYQLGSTFGFTAGGTQAYTFTESSIPVGLRIAWMTPRGFWIGAHGDYYMSGNEVPTSPATVTASDTFSRTVASAEFGYQSPKGPRIYLGYDVSNVQTRTPDTTNIAFSPTMLSGTGYYIGVGWRFAMHMALNVMYDVPSYNTATLGGTGGSTTYTTLNTTNYSALSESLMSVMLSFPFGNAK